MSLHLVTPEWPPDTGGIATWSWLVASALHAAGEEIVVHARARNTPIGAPPFAMVRMFGRSWARWGPVWAAASVLPRLRRGDRVLCATWEMAPRLLRGARVLGVPVAVAWHGSDITRPARLPGRERVIDAVTNLPVSRYLGGLLGAPHHVLPVPIDPIAPARRGEALLVVARLGPLKGVDRAIRLAARFRRPIVIVGEGPAREGLEALAVELGVPATFRGRLPREDIPWDGTWALALLSQGDSDGSGQEGLGLVMLEAAARGIPSIGSAVGGIPEAASVILQDPEHDEVPTLPAGEEVQGRLAATQGTLRTVAALRALLPGGR